MRPSKRELRTNALICRRGLWQGLPGAIPSVRLIKRANAAIYSYCELRSVFQAVQTLGVKRTREITMAIATSIFASLASNVGIPAGSPTGNF